ncbi:MAG TPA: tetratricopeptide repeat protein [Nitrospirota bacterium]|nr:tetratricopeptide repeat protein [Nitrospirota bacterium]
MAIDRNAVIKEAQKFAVKGQFDKALAEWKKFIKESPNDANAFNTIGDLCLKKNAKAEAVDAYKKAADILASDGFTSKAIALYKKVLNIDPKQIEVHLALGDLNVEKGLTGNALESYKLVADYYTHNHDTIKALGIYQKMADLNPSNIAFRLKLGDMYAKENMKTEAVDAYLEAADVHMSKSAFKDARQVFEKVLALDPNNKKVYHKVGIIYFKEGKFVEACKALKPAFEDDPSNQELINIYLDALAKTDRDADAEDVYKKLLSLDSSRIDLREKLYHHYLSKKNYDKALTEVSAMANIMEENKEFDAAETVLKGFVAEVPRSVEGHCKLSEYYKRVARGNDAAKELIHAAEILIEDGDKGGAKDVLVRALEMAPDMADAQQRLESLQATPAGQVPVISEPAPVGPAPATVETPPAVPIMPSSASQSSPIPDEDPVIAEALTEVEVLIKYGLAVKAVEMLEGMAEKFPENLQIRIKLRDMYQEQGKVRKAADHVLVLADIYAKRGMQDQVEPLLRAALEMDPGHVGIAARLGVAPAVEIEAPPSPSEAVRTQESTLDTLVVEGQSAEETMPPEVHPPEVTFGDLEMTPFEPEIAPLAAAPPPDDIVFEEPQSAGRTVEERDALEHAPPAPEVPAGEPSLPVEESPISEPEQRGLIAEAEPEQASHGERSDVELMQQASFQGSPATGSDISEIWAEAEFYYQQGLFEEAKKYYAQIIERSPSDRRAIERLSEISREEEETQEFSKLAEAVEGLESMVSGGVSEGEMALTASDEDAVRSLMSDILKLRQEQKPAPSPPSDEQVAAPVSSESAQKQSGIRDEHEDTQFGGWEQEEAGEQAGEDEFFDLGRELRQERRTDRSPTQQGKSEDFFDLASELRDELSSITVPAQPGTSTDDQSLDDIFEEFKKGVEQQVAKENADTHYNLGVAYKEMGLLDDAIGEFTLTPEGEPKFDQSRYMLGLCYMEKGEYHNAITEIQKALNYSESSGGKQQERIGMHYDLGLAYQGAANWEGALAQFQWVHDANPGYRDAEAKLAELKKGSFISLEQLKDDIEKEISAKFLEEGERIQIEEKTRKNEKVRS